jgi:hypothetical protein
VSFTTRAPRSARFAGRVKRSVTFAAPLAPTVAVPRARTFRPRFATIAWRPGLAPRRVTLRPERSAFASLAFVIRGFACEGSGPTVTPPAEEVAPPPAGGFDPPRRAAPG